MANPALTAFLSQIGDESVLAQVLIRRRGTGFELRHIDDRLRGAGELRTFRIEQLRTLAQFTASGAFRPLKSAPNLASGWVANAQDDAELELALSHLYPGAIPDWYAARSAQPPVTHYREFVGRQTGMYRITQKLGDAEAASTIQACCHRNFCLKRRLWSVPGLEPDPNTEKSLIPCLEPCALLLEFARKVMRIEQEAKLPLELAPSDVATLVDALQFALAHPDRAIPEADMGDSKNPRRMRRLLEMLNAQLKSRMGTERDPSELEE